MAGYRYVVDVLEHNRYTADELTMYLTEMSEAGQDPCQGQRAPASVAQEAVVAREVLLRAQAPRPAQQAGHRPASLSQDGPQRQQAEAPAGRAR